MKATRPVKPAPAAARQLVDPLERATADAVLGALARDAQALALFDRATNLALEDPTTAATTAQDALLMECAVRLQQHADVRALLDLTGTLNRLRRVRDILIDPDAPSGRNAGPARLRPGTELVPGQKTRFFEVDGMLSVTQHGSPAERGKLRPYTDWWAQQLGGAENTTGRTEGSGETEDVPLFLARLEKALRTVWRNKGKPPSADDVARVYPMGRRTLYDRLQELVVRGRAVRWKDVSAWRPDCGLGLQAFLER